jgi:hypothetical protein
MQEILISRNDLFTYRKENPYDSPSNLDALRRIGINEVLIKPFLISVSKATSLKNIFTIALILFIYLLYTVFMWTKCFIVLNRYYYDPQLTFIIYEIYIGCIYSVLILLAYLYHRKMLARAQHIIDNENKRQNAYRFSLSHLTLSLKIAPHTDSERGLVRLTNDSLLKELYTIPDYFRDNILTNFRLLYFRQGAPFFDSVTEDIMSIQWTYKCLTLSILLPLIILLFVCHFFMDGTLLVLVWILLVLEIMFVIRFTMIKKLRAKLDIRNEEYKNQGIYFDLAGNELFIYVFQPFDVIGSYKQDIRTAKYFN